VSCGSDSIILDAGTGIRPLGLEIAKNMPEHPHAQSILLSHTHWDHIQGLPFFAPAYIPGTKINIYGSPRKESFLASILQDQMDNNYFPVKMSELASEITIHEVSGSDIKIGCMNISIQEQFCHPGGSIRFRIEAAGKVIIYATDVELNTVFTPDTPSEEARTMADDYRKFITGADLLIADGQYTAEEYPAKKGWGHTSIPLLIQIAEEHNIGQLAITHHDPDHTDDFIDFLQHKYQKSKNTFWAREGSTVIL
jgi:phosphoribosyl 1,2-cyclic phosphodiesterase